MYRNHLTTLLTGFALFAQAQISLPPSGDNQKASVTQFMGLVSVTIHYSSPDVHAPDGTDRKGKIWGQLVPYGLTNLEFGLSNAQNPSPWRAGANENTTVTVSHDVLVEGKNLAAGTYGLHTIPGEKEWVIIFSKNSTAWGSYFYLPSEDVLRVVVKPVPAEYNEWLTYEFTDRQRDACTVVMKWENLGVPIRITVPDWKDVYVQKIRQELQSAPGFDLQSWIDAANFCTEHKVNLDEALTWANHAIGPEFPGEKNFTTLQTKANVLYAQGKDGEGDAIMAEAIKLPGVSMQNIHAYGRQLLARKKTQQAMEIFKYNAQQNPGQFTTLMGLARGHSALGDYKTALKYAREALPKAPDAGNRTNLENIIKKLEAGQDIN